MHEMHGITTIIFDMYAHHISPSTMALIYPPSTTKCGESSSWHGKNGFVIPLKLSTVLLWQIGLLGAIPLSQITMPFLLTLCLQSKSEIQHWWSWHSITGHDRFAWCITCLYYFSSESSSEDDQICTLMSSSSSSKQKWRPLDDGKRVHKISDKTDNRITSVEQYDYLLFLSSQNSL